MQHKTHRDSAVNNQLKKPMDEKLFWARELGGNRPKCGWIGANSRRVRLTSSKTSSLSNHLRNAMGKCYRANGKLHEKMIKSSNCTPPEPAQLFIMSACFGSEIETKVLHSLLDRSPHYCPVNASSQQQQNKQLFRVNERHMPIILMISVARKK